MNRIYRVILGLFLISVISAQTPKLGVQSRIHISVSGGLELTYARDDIYSALKKSGFDSSEHTGTEPLTYERRYPLSNYRFFMYDFELEFNITHNTRIGFLYYRSPTQAATGFITYTYGLSGVYTHEYGKLQHYSVQYSYHHQMKNKSGKRPSFISVGIGPCLNRINITGDVGTPFKTNKTVIGLTFQSKIEDYFTRSLSYFWKIHVELIPNILAPAYAGIFYEGTQLVLLEHKINFSSIGFSIGFGVHFVE